MTYCCHAVFDNKQVFESSPIFRSVRKLEISCYELFLTYFLEQKRYLLNIITFAFDNHTNLFNFKVLNLAAFNSMSFLFISCVLSCCFESPSFQCRSSPPGGVFSNEEARLLSSSRGNDHGVSASFENGILDF